jgi:hypothetical protein
MPQAGRRGKPRLRRSFALPAPGLPAWPRLRAEILQIKLAHMGYSPGLSTLSKCPNCRARSGQESIAQGKPWAMLSWPTSGHRLAKPKSQSPSGRKTDAKHIRNPGLSPQAPSGRALSGRMIRAKHIPKRASIRVISWIKVV